MTNVYIGQVSMFGGNFAPRGSAMCNGQLLPIAQNQALFSLLGTAYGGDGINTFALPNLQSSLPLHMGQGNGLSNYALGQSGGSTNVTLMSTQMPSHSHMLNATTSPASATAVGNTVIPGTPSGSTTPLFYAAQGQGQPVLTMDPLAVTACSTSGGNSPHSNLMPSLCITFIIALQGIFPSRN